MRNRVASVAVLVVAMSLASSRLDAQAVTRPDSLSLARQYTTWFYTAQFDSLVAHHGAEARADANLRNRLEQALAQLTSRAGTEVEVIDEKFVMRLNQRQYWRTAKFSSYDEPILFRWVLSGEGAIIGMGMGPASQAPPIDSAQ
jgi:hypothetical protein